MRKERKGLFLNELACSSGRLVFVVLSFAAVIFGFLVSRTEGSWTARDSGFLPGTGWPPAGIAPNQKDRQVLRALLEAERNKGHSWLEDLLTLCRCVDVLLSPASGWDQSESYMSLYREANRKYMLLNFWPFEIDKATRQPTRGWRRMKSVMGDLSHTPIAPGLARSFKGFHVKKKDWPTPKRQNIATVTFLEDYHGRAYEIKLKDGALLGGKRFGGLIINVESDGYDAYFRGTGEFEFPVSRDSRTFGAPIVWARFGSVGMYGYVDGTAPPRWVYAPAETNKPSLEVELPVLDQSIVRRVGEGPFAACPLIDVWTEGGKDDVWSYEGIFFSVNGQVFVALRQDAKERSRAYIAFAYNTNKKELQQIPLPAYDEGMNVFWVNPFFEVPAASLSGAKTESELGTEKVGSRPILRATKSHEDKLVVCILCPKVLFDGQVVFGPGAVSLRTTKGKLVPYEGLLVKSPGMTTTMIRCGTGECNLILSEGKALGLGMARLSWVWKEFKGIHYDSNDMVEVEVVFDRAGLSGELCSSVKFLGHQVLRNLEPTKESMQN